MGWNLHIVVASSSVLAIGSVASAQDHWPAEPITEAANLTPLAGPGINDFHFDLSGAVHDLVADRTWICRNGPWPDSKVWSLVRTDEGSWEIERRDGVPCEWSGFDDLEGVTIVDGGTTTILGVVEGPDRLREYDLAIPGEVVLLHEWDISPWTNAQGGQGAEGVAFVPDCSLSAGGFVDGNGLQRTGRRGFGGLVFVGHQAGGLVHVFDLDRFGEEVIHVGSYATSRDETCGLEFDSTTGILYAWHDAGHDELEVLELSSDPVSSGGRKLHSIGLHDAPFLGSTEGISISPGSSCKEGVRDLLLAVDDGGDESLLHFQEFGIHCNDCRPDLDGDRVIGSADLGLLLAAWGDRSRAHDLDRDGQVGGSDLGLLVGSWGACP